MAIVIPVLGVILTQGPVAQWLAARAVRSATGGSFTSSWVSLKLDGRLVISDAVLVAPGLTGEAARVASAKSIEVDLDWSAWAAGVVVPRAVVVDRPVVNLSMDTADSTLNIAALTGRSPGSGGVSVVPRIEVRNGTVIIAEHERAKGTFTPLARFDTHGWVSPVYNSDRYIVQMLATSQENTDASGPPMAINVSGWMSLRSSEGELKVAGIELSRLGPEKLPSNVRDIWSQLRLRGRIASTEIRYTRASGIEATMLLQDVSLRAPIASGRTEIVGSRNPLMENVEGTLRFTTAGPGAGLHAELKGLFEDLPAKVRFESQGLSVNAPYRAVVIADGFQLERDPRILWFTPRLVQKNFERFSGPTALIDARIELARGRPEAPGSPGEITIGGTMIFRNAVATYAIFPYPLHDLSGTIRFNDEKVEIVGVQGLGPSGARVFAEGVLDPPTIGSRTEVDIVATDVPIDEHLWQTLDKSRGKPIVDAAFSRGRLKELAEKGLITPPTGPELNGVPRFAFGGRVDSVRVHVSNTIDPTDLTQVIDVHFDDVGILPEVFPFPLRARNTVVRITDDATEIRGDVFEGLTGGSARVHANIDYSKRVGGKPVYEPTISVDASNLPLDRLLINAIPEERIAGAKPSSTDSGEPGRLSIRSLLTNLNLSGPVSGRINLTPKAGGAPGSIALDADLQLNGLSGQPAHVSAAEAVAIRRLVGGLRVTDQGIELKSLSGEFEKAGTQMPAGGFLIDGRWNYGAAADQSALGIRAQMRKLDVSVGLEDVLAPIVPDAAKAVGELRRDRKPLGVVDMIVSVAQPRAEAAPIDVGVELTGSEGLSLELQGRRVELTQQGGRIEALARVGPGIDEPLRLTLTDMIADMKLDGEPIGRVEATGSISPPSVDSRGIARPLAVHQPLTANLRGLRIDSPITRQLLNRFGGETAAARINELDPAGLLDGELKLTPKDSPTDWSTWAAIRPVWLAFNKGARRVTLPLLSGQITITGKEGAFEELAVTQDDWSARFNGTWSTSDDPAMPAWTIDGLFELDVVGWPDSLVAVLPGALTKAMDESKVQIARGLEATGIKVHARGGRSGSVAYAIDGTIDLHSMYADPGVSIKGAEARVQVRARRDEDKPADITLMLDVARARIGGLKMTDARGELRLLDNGRRMELPLLTATAYGGRVTAHAQGAGEPLAYEATVQLAGVRFADCVNDFKRQSGSAKNLDAEGPPIPDDVALLDELPPDYSRGMIEGDLALSGTFGQSERRGRGAARIAGGKAVVELPLVFDLLQLSHLQLPSGDAFDFGYADFYMVGPRVSLEHVVLLSDPLALVGGGMLNFETVGSGGVGGGGGIDLRFISKSRSGSVRVPVVTDVLEGLRNAVISTRVTGTLAEPSFAVDSFFKLRPIVDGRENVLFEAERVDLDQLERDRQRTLGLISSPK